MIIKNKLKLENVPTVQTTSTELDIDGREKLRVLRIDKDGKCSYNR